MGLSGQINKDIQQITTNLNEFATLITFKAPDGTIATIGGVGVKNHLSFDPNTGIAVSTKQARVSISLQSLLTANYPVRNGNNEIVLVGHLVTWTIAGIESTYKISVNFPGETAGNIVCILQDYKA